MPWLIFFPSLFSLGTEIDKVEAAKLAISSLYHWYYFHHFSFFFSYYH